jgi:oligopeptidase B
MIFPPIAEKKPHRLSMHGDIRVDDYYWLRDDKREDPAVLDYLAQENTYGEAMMSGHEELRHQLFTEMVERIPQQDRSVPYVRRGYRYQSRYDDGNEYAIYTRQPTSLSEIDEWTVLLDGNKRAAQSEFYTMGSLDVSPDNTIIAAAEDFLSRRLYGIRFKNLTRDSWYPEVIENASSGFEWTNDSQFIYYVRKHKKTLLPYQVYRHKVGTAPEQDELIYEEQDDSFYVSVHKTTSERFILIALGSSTSGEILLLDADDPHAEPQLFLPRRHDHEYSLDHFQGHFYLRSNREGKNFGLYRSETANEALWQTLIPARDDVVLESFTLFRDWLVLEERHQGLTSLRQIHWETGEEKGIAFDDPTYVTWLAYNPDPETSWLRYGYSSMTTPTTLFELNMDTGERNLLKQSQVKNFNADDYRSERIWITARDCVEVPVSLVYRKDLFHRGGNPILIYGYGSYGSSMDPDFSASRLSLLDRGFVFALAHIRGGGELGQQWYDDGKLFKKMNTFNDFIDVSRSLIHSG